MKFLRTLLGLYSTLP